MLIAMGWVLLGSPRIGFFNLILKQIFSLSKAPLNIYTFPGMMLVQGITLGPRRFSAALLRLQKYGSGF